MKTKLLFTLPILIFGILVISCSNDDEDEETNVNSSTTLFVGGKQQKTSSLLDGITYFDKTLSKDAELLIQIFGDEENTELTSFQIIFTDIDLNSINVGDDLVKKATVISYQLIYKKDFYYTFGVGSAIVKEFDKSKNIMKVDFDDITLPLHTVKPTEIVIKVNGSIKSVIDIE